MDLISKLWLMDCKFGFLFLMDFDMVQWLMLCVKDLEFVKYHIEEAKGGKQFMITIVGLYLWTFE
jgi:hypothetical protein